MARQKGVVIPISAEENTGRAFAAVDAQVNQLRAQVRSLRAELAGGGGIGDELGKGFGHAVPEIAAASGAIREFEGNLPIRAVERFLTSVLGLGPLLSTLFPLVGGIAFAGMVKEGVDKILEMKKEAEGLGAAIKKAFDEAIAAERLHADELAVTNDKLQQTLDKLEGRPSNGLELGLDEARVKADQLAESLKKDVKVFDELFEKNKVGFFSRLEGQKPIDDIKKQVQGSLAGIDEVRESYDETIQTAIDSGASKGNIADIRAAEMARLQKVYKDAEDNLKPQLAKLRELQKDFLAPYSSGVDHSAEINTIDGALSLFREQQRSLGEQYRNQDLAPKVSAAKAASEGGKDDSGKIAEAQKSFDDAMRRAAEQAAQSRLAAAKLAGDLEVAELDDKHKRQLISDRDYYAQKAAIQEKALESEADAVSAKQGALGDEIRKAIIQRGKDAGDSAALLKDNARIIELQTQINALEDQRTRMVEERRKIAALAGTEDYLAIKKAEDEALKLAANLEAARGGSASARLAQSRDQFGDRLKALQLSGASQSEIDNAKALQAIAEGQISAGDASHGYQGKSAAISADRQRVAYEARAGQISSVEAQRQKIALDAEEAAAMQPLLDAYRNLAAIGVEGAAGKVAELQEKIYELRNPVDEVATHVREQFDGAFSSLFENLDRGTKAFASFGRQIEKIFISEAYKRIIEPGVQAALGAVLPNPQSHAPVSGIGGIGAALGGLIPGVAKLPGVAVAGKSSGEVQVQIINQGAPLESGGASHSTSSDENGFSQRVVSVILKDAETNGSILQALTGAIRFG